MDSTELEKLASSLEKTLQDVRSRIRFSAEMVEWKNEILSFQADSHERMRRLEEAVALIPESDQTSVESMEHARLRMTKAIRFARGLDKEFVADDEQLQSAGPPGSAVKQATFQATLPFMQCDCKRPATADTEDADASNIEGAQRPLDKRANASGQDSG